MKMFKALESLMKVAINSSKISIILLFTLICFGCTKRPQQDHVAQAAHEQLAKIESASFFDTKPNQTPVSYLYAPGFKGTEALMGRYCPRFTACTGEKITWRSGGHTIGQPHTAVNFPEVDLRKPDCFTLNPLRAYINGFRRDLFPVALRFFQERYDFTVEDNPASSKSVVNYSFNFSDANIGQHKDMLVFKKAYQRHLKKFPDTDIILYGDSRGAAIIFNFLAQEKPTQVKAAILEGIFDDIPHLVRHFCYIDKGHRAEKRLINTMKLLLGSYNNKGPFPRDFAKIISDDIPLLFVTSLADELCCPQGAIALYRKLKERGHKKIHLLVLQNCSHPVYMISNPEDKKLYETTVHAFYKHYGLPHNNAKAAEGMSSFKKTQPSSTELKAAYNLPKCTSC